MTSRWIGLWHVRGGPVATLALVVALVVTVAIPDISIAVSAVFDNPARGVGTPEVVTIALAATLPALTVPTFGGREVLAHPRARVAHTVFTLAVTAAPLLVLPVWAATIDVRFRHVDLPPLPELLGSVLFYCCVASLLCLLLGGPLAVVLTPAAFIAHVVAQQTFPGTVLTTWFATGREWNSNWWVTACAATVLLAVSWRLRSVPLRNRR